MSSGGGGARVSIPSSARKMVQNIKEIAGNHSDEEIYAMLKECSMDPDETAQKLLLQDTFHEVKRKRDRRKENVSNREPADASWRSGNQGRGGRSGRGNYSSRYVSHDTGGAKNLTPGKENGATQGPEKGFKTSSVASGSENKPALLTSNSISAVGNGPTKPTGTVSAGTALQGPGSKKFNPTEENMTNNFGSSVSLENDTKSGHAAVAAQRLSGPTIGLPSSMSAASASGVYASATDPILESSSDSHNPCAVDVIKCQVGNQRTVMDQPVNKVISRDAVGIESLSSLSEKTASDASISYMHGKLLSKSQESEVKNISNETQAPPISYGTGASGSRPSSNYSNRSQQLIGPQKVCPAKEWKPKPTNVVHASGVSDLTPAPADSVTPSVPTASVQTSDENTSKLQKKLEELQISDSQHVIFPQHIQVPEAERTVLSFGSFTASFGLNSKFVSGADGDKSSTPLSESSQGAEENAEEPSSSIENAPIAAQEEDHPDQPESSGQTTENQSAGEADVSSNISAGQEYDLSKQEATIAPGGPQYSVVQTAPTYSTYGLVPTVFGSQFATFESSESQTRDASRHPGFVVQQPFDPSTSYYTQMYRQNADADGRYSPFVAPGAGAKYSAALPAQADQSPQEGGNSLVQPASVSAPIVTQAAGVLQNSAAVTQQPLPVFRQPAGVQISHYPHNYIPYSHYFSPFYVPPPVHPFLSNTAFPQQHPAGSIYPPVAPASTPVKYSLSQYKAGTNSSHSTHVGMPPGYGPFSSSPTGYSPTPAASTVNSTSNEDLTSSQQYKDNNVYLTGQQSEGSTLWIAAPGRDIPGLQANSFYNLPPQGQHVTFSPAQAGHGAFPGMYHPSQMAAAAAATVHPLLQQSQTVAGAVEMAGPQAGAYQPPQRGQINWTNNY